MKNQHILGIYSIENIINGKRYIGSSNNIAYRFKKHLCELKNQRHRNKHFQSAVNKYGIENFRFQILEQCQLEELRIKEQFYIDSYNWETLYNKTKFSIGGGGDLTGKEVILIDLDGNIVKEFKSGCALAKYINRSALNYQNINTPIKVKKCFRIVTPIFYRENKQQILTW